MAIKKSGSVSTGKQEQTPFWGLQSTFSRIGIAKLMKLSMAAMILLAIGLAALFNSGPNEEPPTPLSSEVVSTPATTDTRPVSVNPAARTLEEVQPTTSKQQNLDPEHPSLIAKQIIVTLVRNTERDEEWGTRIAKVEIAPLINQLYLARKKGFKPNLATYKTDAYPPDDMELLNELQQSIQKRPDLNLLVEGMLRQYGLMHCETLDAALRSWLIPS
tara:strand:- start:3155 stop:3805 length:651 start_codon:yes stop_codon:yes gene_type:complete